MAALLKLQNELKDQIAQAYRDYEAEKIKRDEDSVRTFRQLVNEMWERFEKNHDKLLTSEEIDASDPYYTKDTFRGMKQVVDNLLHRTNERLKTYEKEKSEILANNEVRRSMNLLSDEQPAETDERSPELKKLVALYNTKLDILSTTMEKTQEEQNIGAIYLQQKIKSLEAQWKSLTTLAHEILKVENTSVILKKIMEAQERFDQGLTHIQGKARNIEQVKLPTSGGL